MMIAFWITFYISGYLICCAGTFRTQHQPGQETALLVLCLFWPLIAVCVFVWYAIIALRHIILWLTHPEH